MVKFPCTPTLLYLGSVGGRGGGAEGGAGEGTDWEEGGRQRRWRRISGWRCGFGEGGGRSGDGGGGGR